MIKSLSKRKAIAEMIYNQYVALTEEEKTLHEDEVGAAFKGYELAIEDACEWLKENSGYYVEHWDGDTWINSKLYADFRKAMMEE